MILDIYFRRPVFYDYLLAFCTILVLSVFLINGKVSLPKAEDSYSLTGDLTNIALTLIGFILTILTVFITFKDNSNPTSAGTDEPLFKRFFSTGYYFETIKHLKNCIKSIALVAACGFVVKMFFPIEIRLYLFFYNIAALIIIMLTVYRCLLILGKILEMQRPK
ncbi:hypothetical protein DQQ10_18920 [Pseudochryseolinea flava]|uniref:Uncharacterized protein n=1 Tax=Pseudochryseolinea flava TaxID=2059302 RepID=A0A364XZD6_9BACT|nr:hypothetical protein DQQ10_18920 [Pseudochryseolinea flava]